jgi:hypothetical protein
MMSPPPPVGLPLVSSGIRVGMGVGSGGLIALHPDSTRDKITKINKNGLVFTAELLLSLAKVFHKSKTLGVFLAI